MRTRIVVCVACMVIGAVLFQAVRRVKGQNLIDSPPAPSDFIVVDNNGKLIGQVIGAMQFSFFGPLIDPDGRNALALVALPFQGKWLTVFVLRNTFQGPHLLFASSDCTGQPYGDPSQSPFLATGVSADNGLYFESGPSRSITVQSIFNSAGSGGLRCQSGSFGNADVVPMAPAVNLNVFTPPFRAVAREK